MIPRVDDSLTNQDTRNPQRQLNAFIQNPSHQYVCGAATITYLGRSGGAVPSFQPPMASAIRAIQRRTNPGLGFVIRGTGFSRQAIFD